MFIAFFAEGIGIWLLYLCASHPLLFVLLSGVVFFAWGPIGDRNWRGGYQTADRLPEFQGPKYRGSFRRGDFADRLENGKIIGRFSALRANRGV